MAMIHPRVCVLGSLANLDRKLCFPRGSQQGSLTIVSEITGMAAGVGVGGTEVMTLPRGLKVS